MPGLVISMEVVPPRRTENSGMSLSRKTFICLRLEKSGSHFSLASMGASWPRAEKVIWLPRSSVCAPQVLWGLKPNAAMVCPSEPTIFCFSSTVKSSE